MSPRMVDEDRHRARGGRVKACRSCRAPIVWAKSASTGKAMLFDAVPVDAGDWQFVDGQARRIAPGEHVDPERRFTCHFATCPQADEWRGARPVPA